MIDICGTVHTLLRHTYVQINNLGNYLTLTKNPLLFLIVYNDQ